MFIDNGNAPKRVYGQMTATDDEDAQRPPSPACSIAWHKGPPTEPGWYWFENGGSLWNPMILLVSWVGESLRVVAGPFVPGGLDGPGIGVIAFSSDAQWAGPIPEPPKQ